MCRRQGPLGSEDIYAGLFGGTPGGSETRRYKNRAAEPPGLLEAATTTAAETAAGKTTAAKS